MKEIKISTKSLRKAAFAVGFGLYFGKEVAKLVDVAFNAGVKGMVTSLAANGNKYAQDLCEKADVKYTDDSKKENSEETMGFHA